MKRIVYAMFIALMLFPLVSFAQTQAETKGIYIGLIGGYVLAQDIDTEITNLANPLDRANFDVSLKDGYLFGAKVGWLTPFTNRILAIEFEYNYLASDFEGMSISTPPVPGEYDADGKIQLNLFMTNVLGRYPYGRFHPFAGIGAGYAHISLDNSLYSNNPYSSGYYRSEEGNAGAFAYQFMAGLDIDITKNIILGFSYKYLGTTEFSYEGYWDNTGTLFAVEKDMKYSSHNFILSVCYMF